MISLNQLVRSGRADLFSRDRAPSGPRGPEMGREHDTRPEEGLLRYVNPDLMNPFDFGNHENVFHVHQPGTELEDLARDTRFFIFIGACDSPQFRYCAGMEDSVCMVFEPSRARLAEFVRDLDPAMSGSGRCLFFGGDFMASVPSLSEKLKDIIRELPTAALLQREGMTDLYPDYVDDLTRYMDILTFRYRVYPVQGQWFNQSLPIRDINRERQYDHVKHTYENIGELAYCPSLNPLAGAFKDFPAILVAAGPDLRSRLEFIRKNQERAVIIAVSRTLGTLSEAGIRPHFAIINDTSVAAEPHFHGLVPMPGTYLAAHGMSPLGQGLFERTYLFGNVMPELFGPRPMLRLHGSVISTAFSLAMHLGCDRAAMVAVQLASTEPYRFTYSPGSADDVWIPENVDERPRVDRFPQFVPVTAMSGREMFTSMNFLDAALYLAEEIRISGIRMVNTSMDSIVTGQGIEFDPHPDLGRGPKPLSSVMASLPYEQKDPDVQPILAWARAEIAIWRDILKATAKYRKVVEDTWRMDLFNELLTVFDANGTTYMLERFPEFDANLFNNQYYNPDNEEMRRKVVSNYLSSMVNMATQLRDTLAGSLARLAKKRP